MPVLFIPKEEKRDPHVHRFRLWLRVAFLPWLYCYIQRPFCKKTPFPLHPPPCAPGIHQKMPNCDGRTLGLSKDNLHESSVSESTLLLNINVIQQHSNQRAQGQKTPQKHVFVCSGPCSPVGFVAINFWATEQTVFCKEGCKLPRELIGLYCFNKTSWETDLIVECQYHIIKYSL